MRSFREVEKRGWTEREFYPTMRANRFSTPAPLGCTGVVRPFLIPLLYPPDVWLELRPIPLQIADFIKFPDIMESSSMLPVAMN